MEFKFVAIDSKEYQEGILVREKLFFKDFPNAQMLLNDGYEQNSIHLVAVDNDQVIGTGRLTILKSIALISQMTVLPNWQRKSVGAKLLQLLIKEAESMKVSVIELSSRITAQEFYRKHGFIPVGEVYPSVKTGVLHQKMILESHE